VDVFGYFAPPFTCTAGCVYGWGSSYLGTRRNASTPAPTPSLVFGLDHVVAIDNMHEFGVTYAVREDGTLWAWGGNIYGNLGNGATCVNDTFPDRTTICYSDVPVRVIGLDHVTAVSGGMYTAYALRNDGTVWQIGPTATPTQVTGVSNVTALAGDGFTDFALESDGTVWAWGSNNQGLLGIGDTTVTYSQTPVQVHDLAGVTTISMGLGGEALGSDGTVWTWGPYGKAFNTGDVKAGDSSLPLPVTGLTGVTGLSGEHALKADGTVWSWGADNRGDLGRGTHGFTVQPTPVQTQVTGAVTLAKHLNGAVLSDGTARTWGDNLFGQLGNGRTGGEADAPVPVVGLAGVTALSGSGTSGYALTLDG
jgi:alpha-tubulin suppressor-like RCC1 family protein